MKSLVIIASLFCSLAAFSADRIYQLDSSQDFSALRSESLVDSIPQLNIVVLKSDAKEPMRSSYLGEILEINTEVVADDQVPKGYWGLDLLDAAGAWQLSKGEGIVVAVADTGVQFRNWDLDSNIWKNSGETGLDSRGNNKESNKVDDDHNGFVDDVYGWDFVHRKGTSGDNQYHGTHVAGTIAAELSPRISGVAPKAKIMIIPFLDKKGSGSDLNAAKSIIYAADNGARIINCSWGGHGVSETIEKAIEYARQKGLLVVAAAGNKNENTDRLPHSPSSMTSPAILAVAAVERRDGSRAGYTNFGKVSVDLAAPGTMIRSTSNSRGYKSLSGTSMATPHASGVASLVWSLRPELSADQIKEILMDSATKHSAWQDLTVTGGILNARAAVERALRY